MSRAGDTPPQDVRFCRSADGTRIAYAVHGSGPPLLLAACWLSHLEFDWQSPVWRHFLLDLGRVATVIRYDNSRELHQTGEKPQVVSAGWPSEWCWRTTRTAA